MKKIFVVLALVFCSNLASAQKARVDELQIIQTVFGMSKKEVIANYIKVPIGKESDFWTAYDNFEITRQSLSRARFQTIDDYASNYFNLDDHKANQLANEILINNMKLENLNAKSYGKFKKILGGLEAAKLIQLEVFIQSQIKSALQNNIPFIGEIKTK